VLALVVGFSFQDIFMMWYTILAGTILTCLVRPIFVCRISIYCRKACYPQLAILQPPSIEVATFERTCGKEEAMKHFNGFSSMLMSFSSLIQHSLFFFPDRNLIGFLINIIYVVFKVFYFI
jgi:hypothetical protein